MVSSGTSSTSRWVSSGVLAKKVLKAWSLSDLQPVSWMARRAGTCPERCRIPALERRWQRERSRWVRTRSGTIGASVKTSSSGFWPMIITSRVSSVMSAQPGRTSFSRVLVSNISWAISIFPNPRTSPARRSRSFGQDNMMALIPRASILVHQETLNTSKDGQLFAMILQVVFVTIGRPVRFKFANCSFVLNKLCNVDR